MNRLFQIYDLIKSMGIKPIAYRVIHTIKKKTGILKKSFPTESSNKNFISLEEWKKQNPAFFFDSKESLTDYTLDESSKKDLDEEYKKIKEGYLKFFNGQYIFLGKDDDWITNPDSKYKYDINRHFTELETLDEKKGDIKYVWEKSRFCFLYTIIRHDYHFKEDHSELVFSEILSWIKHNPLNMGPNYSCSQEISLRILNWLFAIYYYKNSKALTEERLKTIINSIYDQSKHVEEHLNFSLITVRNNHAITESLLLYSVGLLFPFFNESEKWKNKGKKYLEQEGLYQIYEDGSYIQFSMNYERVVLQLYTWAFYLSKANNESFSPALNDRLCKVVNYLYQCQDIATGKLPNYGSNDGALFFPLNNSPFRDYRPQLNVMNYFLSEKSLYKEDYLQEDLFWFGNKTAKAVSEKTQQTSSFNTGGYYLLRNKNSFSFIRCGNHPDRPLQADNLHLDIWYNSKNILRDAGSYKYNASKEDIKFFMGTASHNTVMVEDYDQMQKGGRFLWYYWTKAVDALITETDEATIFKGSIKAFHHVSKNIIHTRTVKQYKNIPKWEIEDIITGTDMVCKQIWNLGPDFSKDGFKISCTDKTKKPIKPYVKDAFYSTTYGIKEESMQLVFESNLGYFNTTIIRSANSE